ncbi:hypothetical protein [Halomonas sp. PR-M31]|uniref:hypothetical protein n=1 Tax=Halomonas sp. PR-M31 TaxID=1471202 RepID=UPI000651E00A|nr:hypothetical protein [Halomonas sp. PR-M31]
MPTLLKILPVFMSIMIASMATQAQEMSRTTPAGKHPYDIAVEYCAERGGIAQYSVKTDSVRFSCSDEPTVVINISS